MIRIIERKTELLRWIAWQDEAVTCDKETYLKYLETLDQELLGLEGTPQVFVLRPPSECDHRISREQSGGVLIAGMGADLRASLALVQRCLVEITPWPEADLGDVKAAWNWDAFEKQRLISIHVLKLFSSGLISDCAYMLLNCLVSNQAAVIDTKKN